MIRSCHGNVRCVILLSWHYCRISALDILLIRVATLPHKVFLAAKEFCLASFMHDKVREMKGLWFKQLRVKDRTKEATSCTQGCTDWWILILCIERTANPQKLSLNGFSASLLHFWIALASDECWMVAVTQAIDISGSNILSFNVEDKMVLSLILKCDIDCHSLSDNKCIILWFSNVTNVTRNYCWLH